MATQPSSSSSPAPSRKPLDRALMPHNEIVLVLDFGGQTAQLIARRVREAGAFSLLISPRTPTSEIKALAPKGIILSGGPSSVYDDGAPTCDPELFNLGIPVLGICYGMQLACHMMGFRVDKGESREFGRAALSIKDRKDLFGAIPEKTAVWMSHGDQVHPGPAGTPTLRGGSGSGSSTLRAGRLEVLASTDTCPIAAARVVDPMPGGLKFYGVQFHPEVTHTPHGVDILRNFLYEICKCSGSWRMADFLDTEIKRVRDRVGKGGVICGLSGGVDSSVCAALLHKAIGDQLQCIFVDTGLLRKSERELVETTFRDHFHIRLKVIDASAQFLADLKGITEPQEKRKRIGARFIRVFEDAQISMGLHGHNFLAQGTLYPDVIESGQSAAGTSAAIKLHHNVGGLPDDLEFDLLEPLRDLFKDEVRKLGEVLGLPDQIIWRHPFPGPGLAVRILGEVTDAKLDILRDADEILLEEIVSANLYRSTSQVFAVLLPVKSVGVMGDGRTYESTIAVRAVETQDFMTADWARIPFNVLATISNRIINEVRGVNRVVYDISSKPPATIEWE